MPKSHAMDEAERTAAGVRAHLRQVDAYLARRAGRGYRSAMPRSVALTLVAVGVIVSLLFLVTLVSFGP